MQKLATEIELEQVIGESALIRLEQDFGGESHYIPTSERGYQEFKNTLTLSEFRILIYYYGGTKIYIPKQIIKSMRDSEIATRYRKGECSASLAKEYCLSDRQIRNIAAQA